MSDHTPVTATEPVVSMTVQMTPEDYVALQQRAAWTHGKNVAQFMVDSALNRLPRGC